MKIYTEFKKHPAPDAVPFDIVCLKKFQHLWNIRTRWSQGRMTFVAMMSTVSCIVQITNYMRNGYLFTVTVLAYIYTLLDMLRWRKSRKHTKYVLAYCQRKTEAIEARKQAWLKKYEEGKNNPPINPNNTI